MDLYLIRHTPSSAQSGFCYGQTDLPPANTFDADAALVESALPVAVGAVYSSPLRRCKTLAEHLAGHFGIGQVTTDPRLKELSFGSWEGRQWSELPPEKLQSWMDDFVVARPPGGESLLDLIARTNSFFDTVAQTPHDRAIVVTHAGVIRAAWHWLLGIPPENLFKIAVPFGAIHHLRLSDDARTHQLRGTRDPLNAHSRA